MCIIICQSGLSTRNGGPCVLCESGKYKTIAGTGFCIDACPLNTNLEQGVTLINDCLCVVGYSKEDSELCTSCISGKYKSGLGNDPCVLCESGKYKTIAGPRLCDNTCPLNTNSE